MIPLVIHYCWFGNNEKSKLEIKCIDSWKKYFPNYKIIEWNETNFDINCCPYVKEAYEQQKWAFVTDYVRFKVLYDYGGIYFDTDVQVLKSMKRIIAAGPYMALEDDAELFVAPGLGIASYPGHPIYKEIIDDYNRRHFLLPDGTCDLKTVVIMLKEVMIKHGLQHIDGVQCIENILVYPKEYFCPMDSVTGIIKYTKNTYTIHHYRASWMTKKQQIATQKYWKKCRKNELLYNIRNLPNRIVNRIVGDKIYSKMKKIARRI